MTVELFGVYSGELIRTVTGEEVTISGELKVDGVSVAYFDRDSGDGWLVVEGNDVLFDEGSPLLCKMVIN